MYCMGHASESITNLLTANLFRKSVIHESVPDHVKGSIKNEYFTSNHKMIN